MLQKQESPFRLLMTKRIYAILDGDTTFDDYTFGDDSSTTKIAMPYLSGPDLCNLSTRFGCPATYAWGGTNLSRWQYLENLLEYCTKENRCSDLLAYLFDKQQFSAILAGHEVTVIQAAYEFFVQTIITKINGILNLS